MTFPLKLVEKCFRSRFVLVVLFNFLTKFKDFILGRFKPRSLCNPLDSFETDIAALAIITI